MTKKELIEHMEVFPDDAEISVCVGEGQGIFYPNWLIFDKKNVEITLIRVQETPVF